MKKASVIFGAVIVVAVVGFFAWKNLNSQGQSSESKSAEIPADSETPVIKYPVTSILKNEPVPQVGEVDKNLQRKAPDFFGKLNYADVLIFEDFIRHFVVAMDNAMGKQIPLTLSPVKPAPGELVVTASGDEFILSEKNFERYQRYMDLLQGADFKEVVNYYRQVYPLFQAAYQELGTSGYFNDKVVEVIDNVLATPEVTGPIHLKRPNIRYQFADPELESLSAIQKIALRMGPDNLKIIKTKFKELRQMLSSLN